MLPGSCPGTSAFPPFPPPPPPEGSHFCIGGGAEIEKPGVLRLSPRDPRSPAAPVRASPAPRALGTRSPARSCTQKAARGGPPEPARPPGACEAARTLPGRSAKVHCEARPERRPRPGLPRPRPRRAPPPRPPPALPGARAARPAPRRPARDAPSSTSLACGLGGLRAGRGAPDGIAGSPRALTCAAHSTGVAGRLGREVSVAPAAGGSLCGPAPAHARTSRPPGGPTGRAASAPVRTRRAACHRARRRRRSGRGPARGARGGARRRPRGPPAAGP